ncbi:hypothetical protein C1645_838836 [Glomus cerebriforme]|uniref:Uncharacterized protein n=1 Tax=Glomus cerebriforme TaxID=658196 RepID=A0A397S7S7_9GLOM|nr:hypothetical protein C1645_838836 [Glomus cerebriforme]
MKIDAQGIDSRRGHTAVLTSDNRIIVYGGVRDDNSEALPQLVVLGSGSFHRQSFHRQHGVTYNYIG